MRIIAGKYRGRKLIDTKHLKDLRPTTDANRENLFNIILSSKNIKEIGFELKNCNVLDVFCGTGAISFEAISRGARSATLIDKNRLHLENAQENAKILKESNLEYLCLDLSHKMPKAKQQFNLIFIDPPYSKNLAAIAVQNLIDSGWIENQALIIIEHSSLENLQPLERKLEQLEQRRYKETFFTFLKIKPCF
jgi:16S rRNA (guanine966-N2)-methyltransferase